jgi:hypothetical protein
MEKEITTIQLSKKTRQKLVKLKYDFKCRGYDELIERILEIFTKFKLYKELEMIKK